MLSGACPLTPPSGSGAVSNGGRAVRLERLDETHLALVTGLVFDEQVRRFTRIPSEPPPGFPHAWLSGYLEGGRHERRAGFVVLDGAGTPVGLAVVPRFDRETATAELGYIVAAAARGRGVATGALALLGAWAFTELEAQRLELLIDVDNEASKRVAERSGYVCEGVLRSLFVKENLRRDTEIWSLLPSDP